MNLADFKREIKTLGIICSEAEFPKAKAKTIEVKPPFICYLKDIDKSIWAGGKCVFTDVKLIVELYVEKDDSTSKTKLLEWFKAHNLGFTETETTWISSEKFYVHAFNVILT
jgi:hypothetical protein